jgi:hypothetical protein
LAAEIYAEELRGDHCVEMAELLAAVTSLYKYTTPKI